MSEISVFSEIVTHQIQAVMLHDDLANMFDFLCLKGFKRQQEYYAMKEFAEMRGTCRYMINHLNSLPDGVGSSRYIEIIPSAWRKASRFEVSENERKSKVKDLLMTWHKWETESKDFYQKKSKEMCEYGAITSSIKINEILESVDKELKKIERCVLKLSATGWDMSVIIPMQSEIHDKYEKKAQEEMKVKFC